MATKKGASTKDGAGGKAAQSTRRTAKIPGKVTNKVAGTKPAKEAKTGTGYRKAPVFKPEDLMWFSANGAAGLAEKKGTERTLAYEKHADHVKNTFGRKGGERELQSKRPSSSSYYKNANTSSRTLPPGTAEGIVKDARMRWNNQVEHVIPSYQAKAKAIRKAVDDAFSTSAGVDKPKSNKRRT